MYTVEPTGSGSERISEKKILSEQGEEFDSLAANQKRLKIQNVLLERLSEFDANRAIYLKYGYTCLKIFIDNLLDRRRTLTVVL